MCDIIAHRGPDDAGYAFFRTTKPNSTEGGYWCSFADAQFRHINEQLPVLGGQYCKEELSKHDFSVALGHRRLSIIDLTHYGHQPMSNSDCRIWISYNGEIYNFPQLRDKMRALGHTFRTSCDTEVILHLWEEYGLGCLEKLDGMFALAIYDRTENVLVLARDRFGVKPVYYGSNDDYLVFGSEIKALLASQLLTTQINPRSLVEYFTFQNILGANTLFENIRILQPGKMLICRPESNEPPKLETYFKGFGTADISLAEHKLDTRNQVAEKFSQAVKRQLISDVEVGAYLSGGMDSGAIVSVAGRSIPRMLTFTGGFDLTNISGIEQGFDERSLAEKLSHLLQTEHYDVVLHAGDMPAAMDKISWHMDDPRVGMCHQNWYVSKLASKFVKVCLSGAGGDELFAGYPWRYCHGLTSENFDQFDQAFFRYWHRFDNSDKTAKIFNPDLRQYSNAPLESYRQVMAEAPEYQNELSRMDNMIQRALYFEFKTFMHGYLITEDHISMAHSLETRVPFLDNDLAELAWRIPPSMKLNSDNLRKHCGSGHIESVDGKTVLRIAMQSYLPKEFTHRRKQGFSPPDENWYRGPSMDYIKTILLDNRTLDRPWFDTKVTRTKLDEHFKGKRNHRLLIWSLLSFEWLQRHFLDSSVTEGTVI